MTDHLDAALRQRTQVGNELQAIARAAYAAAVATGWPEDAHTEVVGHILDHLDHLDHLAAQAAPPALEPDRDPECVKRWPECQPSTYDPACCRWPKSCSCNVLPEPEPEPDYGPRPAGCCGTCPPVLGGGYDCTCADNPRCDANKADRHDRDGEPWRWCDECDGFRMGARHKPGIGWNAAEIDERYGPLTFAPRPAYTPTAAPQPEQAHGDAAQPSRPELNVQTMPCVTLWAPAGTHAWSIRPDYADQLRADAWDEGHRTGRQDERNACHCEAWPADECGCGNYGNSTTPNPYRKDRA